MMVTMIVSQMAFLTSLMPTKSISDWNKLSLEVLKLKCMDAALSGRGSRVNLASRLFYHYHPSPILQSDDRPRILDNTALAAIFLNR